MYLEISNPMDYHVALYIRLSKEDESEGPSESVTNQKSLLNEFVQQHRLSVYDTYIDDGWSGTSFNRPAFQRMIGDIETKKVNMVITKDLSHTFHQFHVKTRCRGAGCREAYCIHTFIQAEMIRRSFLFAQTVRAVCHHNGRNP